MTFTIRLLFLEPKITMSTFLIMRLIVPPVQDDHVYVYLNDNKYLKMCSNVAVNIHIIIKHQSQ